MVVTAQVSAILIFNIAGSFQLVVRAAHTPAGRGDFTLWYSHQGPPNIRSRRLIAPK